MNILRRTDRLRTPEDQADRSRRNRAVVAAVGGIVAVNALMQTTRLMGQAEAFEVASQDSEVPAAVRRDYRDARDDAWDDMLPYTIVLVAGCVATSGALLRTVRANSALMQDAAESADAAPDELDKG